MSRLSSILGIDPSDIGPPIDHYSAFSIRRRGCNPKPFFGEISNTVPLASRMLRLISAPSDQLKAVQRAILDKILIHVPPHPAATAYYSGRSIASNAKAHHLCAYLLKTDVVNFFPSIRGPIVERALRAHLPHLAHEAISEIMELTMLEGALPQGAPTSPHLANLALKTFDEKIARISEGIGAVYTRYADDISISAKNGEALDCIEHLLRFELGQLDLKTSDRKTHRFGPKDRKIVTGLDVSAELIRPPRAFRKKTAALVRMTEKYPGRMERHRRRIGGYLAFWEGVSPDDPELLQLKKRLRAGSDAQHPRLNETL